VKRFIVALNSGTKEQNAVFKQFIRDREYGWWHWLSDLWLLTDSSGVLTAAELNKELNNIYPGVRKVVFELRGKNDAWAGFGPIGEDKNMFNWIKKNW
jgi:hypothetical protein